jgi:hypothetical protein
LFFRNQAKNANAFRHVGIGLALQDKQGSLDSLVTITPIYKVERAANKAVEILVKERIEMRGLKSIRN